jgi:exopolyphosphatase/pppGpp-phosphohydrolase
VRDAANRDLILDRVEAEAGVRPQFLSGVDEARLIYLAVHQCYGWSAGRLLILDIGGGSMEIVLGRDAVPELAMSLPLGAARLTRLFLPDDPPSRGQLAALRRHVNATLGKSPTGCSGRGFRNGPSVPPRRSSSSPTFPVRLPSGRVPSCPGSSPPGTLRPGFRGSPPSVPGNG